MNLERLEMMRVMMERVAAGSWKPAPMDNQPDLLNKVDEHTGIDVNRMDLSSWATQVRTQDRNICGFSACAVGHACFDEQFRELGWSWRNSLPVFAGKTDWRAVELFFGFKHEVTANHLFAIGHYQLNVKAKYQHLPARTREAKMVADRVQELMTMGETDFTKKYRGLV